MILYCFTVVLTFSFKHTCSQTIVPGNYVGVDGEELNLDKIEQLWILGHLHLMIFQHDEVTLS